MVHLSSTKTVTVKCVLRSLENVTHIFHDVTVEAKSQFPKKSCKGYDASIPYKFPIKVGIFRSTLHCQFIK